MKTRNLIARTLLKICFLTILCFLGITTVQGQTNQPKDDSFDSPTSPPNCEMWLFYLDDALLRWNKNKDASFIVIARLGDGEFYRRTNQKRIKTLKGYFLRQGLKDKAVFAEGERIKGFGVIEIYVEGKLLYSLPVYKKENVEPGCPPA